MFKTLAVAATLAMPASFAIAQTATTPVAPATTTGMSADKGLTQADTATMAVRFVTTKPADFMTSRLLGVNVYNKQNESVGEIKDFVIDNGRTVSGVIVSVGGFLGLGESYVVLDPSTVVLNDKDGSWRAYVDTTKDALKNAPKFEYPKKS
jgi:sporulation protein YlmC with PRC-barrel domain